MKLHRSKRSHLIRHAAFGVVAVLTLASCDPGWVNPFVGSGTAGTTTVTVPDAQAQLTTPTGVAAPPGGGFYVYDSTACAIYREQGRQTSVFAGTPGTCGNSGDGGAATSATLDNAPSHTGGKTPLHGPGYDLETPLAVGPDGSVYFVELSVASWESDPQGGTSPEYTSQIRRIGTDGVIDTVGDPVVSDPTKFYTAVTVTPGGDVLATIAGASGSTIERIAADGTGTTVLTTDAVIYALAAISDTEVAAETTDAVVRLDLTTGALTATQVPTMGGTMPLAAAPDGTIYAAPAGVNYVVRVTDAGFGLIAGDSTADPGTSAQMGHALHMKFSPTGLALTPHKGLLISSGHVVYRLADPATAPVP